MEPTLDPFQHEVLDFFDRTHGRAIYADPVGSRKTGTTLTWLARTDNVRTLIVAPGSVHGHWAREATRFYPDASVRVAAKSAAHRKAALEETLADEYPTVYITTYESMKADEERLLKSKFDGVVFDEGHRLKGRTTGVALVSNAVTKAAKHLLVVTGTPVMNYAEELWQYLHLLDRKKYHAFWKWANYFFVVELNPYINPNHIVRLIHNVKPEREAELRASVKPYMIQREIGELFPGEAWVQEPEHIVIEVDLTPAERRAYDKMVKDKWTMINDEVLQATNALAVTTRLRQLASDWGTLDVSLADGAKVVAAAELIGDLARRETIVVFTSYKATAHRLVARLQKKGLRARAWTGDESRDEHEAVLEEFGKGVVDVVVGTLSSLGEGVDGLQRRGSTIVMLDRDWVPAINEQAIGRRRRSGQGERVSVYHVMARDTIDTLVVQACLNKTNVAEMLKDRPMKDNLYGVGFSLT